jgi:hypothetical protein
MQILFVDVVSSECIHVLNTDQAARNKTLEMIRGRKENMESGFWWGVHKVGFRCVVSQLDAAV